MGEVIHGFFGSGQRAFHSTHIPKGICQFHIAIMESDPLIWRRILVRSETTLEQLYRIVHVSMGWKKNLIYRFDTVLGEIGNPDLDRSLGLHTSLLDGRKIRVADVVFNVGDCLLFEYGPGARWLHEIQYEAHLTEHRYNLPRCIGGERACPPDSVSGLVGYHQVIDALGNRKHPQYLESQSKVPPNFHPAIFDRNRVNRQLRRMDCVP